MTQMKTAYEILAWLETNVTYFEHGQGANAYWPHSEIDSVSIEKYFDKTLLEYVSMRINEETEK